MVLSNKIRAILMLIVAWVIVFMLYYWFFILNKWDLTIESNMWNYEVSLYAKNLRTSFNTTCQYSICEMIDIAPFEYTLTISKDWYKDIVRDIKIKARWAIAIDVELEKDLKIEKIPDQVAVDGGDELVDDIELGELEQKQLEVRQKQEQLARDRLNMLKWSSYKYFDIDDLWLFYFVEWNNNDIELFRLDWDESISLFTFTKELSRDIFLDKIYQTNNMIVISFPEDKYLYDLDLGISTKVFFPQELNYVKKEQKIYHFVNDKWTFLYTPISDGITYFQLFRDFINYDSKNYLGIIYWDEEQKKKNYNIKPSDDGLNLVVKYNYDTRELDVLKGTPMTITKIIKQDNIIYIYDINSDIYEISNIK